MMAGDKTVGLWAAVTQIVQREAGDWDLSGPAPISAQTLLKADLGLDSLSLMRVIAASEEFLGKHDLPFERILVHDGVYVEELTVGELVNFLVEFAG